LPCSAARLGRVDHVAIRDVFRSQQLDDDWAAIEQEIAPLSITERAGGINDGDRRALYYLVRHLRPSSVLEIGTHIGASTAHIAAALRESMAQAAGVPSSLVSVDIRNVNDPVTMPWIAFGARYSPREMVKTLGCDDFVTFVTGSSMSHLSKCQQRYDLVFLDGDHSAAAVYQEIPAALLTLSEGGLILLHDYFPDLRPLWPDGAVIPGPCLATQRLQREGASIAVIPLGELPWQTKLGSRVTSLALVGRGRAHMPATGRKVPLSPR